MQKLNTRFARAKYSAEAECKGGNLLAQISIKLKNIKKYSKFRENKTKLSVTPKASPGRSSRRRVPGNALARFWGSDVAGDEGTPGNAMLVLLFEGILLS